MSGTEVVSVGSWSWDDPLVEVFAGADVDETVNLRGGLYVDPGDSIQFELISIEHNSFFSGLGLIPVDAPVTPADIETYIQAALDIRAPGATVSVTGDTWTGIGSGDVTWNITGTGFGYVVPAAGDQLNVDVSMNTDVPQTGWPSLDGILLDVSPVPTGAVMDALFFAVTDDFAAGDPCPAVEFALYPAPISIPVYEQTGRSVQLIDPGNPDGIYQRQVTVLPTRELPPPIGASQELPLGVIVRDGEPLSAGKVEILARYFVPDTTITTTTPDWSNNGD